MSSATSVSMASSQWRRWTAFIASRKLTKYFVEVDQVFPQLECDSTVPEQHSNRVLERCERVKLEWAAVKLVSEWRLVRWSKSDKTKRIFRGFMDLQMLRSGKGMMVWFR